MIKIFFDTEFTGLKQDCQLISIGVVSDTGKKFYAELNDYVLDKEDEGNYKWITNNVIKNLLYNKHETHVEEIDDSFAMKGNKEEVKNGLIEWLNQFEGQIEVWSDTLAYDWVLFCQLFGGALKVPTDKIYYIPFDLVTLMKVKGVDPDISREEFSGYKPKKMAKHNSLFDAIVIKECYEKLMRKQENI